MGHFVRLSYPSIDSHADVKLATVRCWRMLSKLDPSSSIKPGSALLLTARRNSGKTVLMRDIMSHMRETIDLTIAMTPSVSSAEMLKEHMPHACVHGAHHTAPFTANPRVRAAPLSERRAGRARRATRGRARGPTCRG